MTSDEVDFNQIKDATKATSGNISVQIKKLQEAGYIEVVKSFKNNYQNTSLKITTKGIQAFEDYVESLKQYIQRQINNFFYQYSLYYKVIYQNDYENNFNLFSQLDFRYEFVQGKQYFR